MLFLLRPKFLFIFQAVFECEKHPQHICCSIFMFVATSFHAFLIRFDDLYPWILPFDSEE